MKHLGKLIINPEKVIKNEELVNLRGRYGGGGMDKCYCCHSDGAGSNELLGTILLSSEEDCWDDCKLTYTFANNADWNENCAY